MHAALHTLHQDHVNVSRLLNVIGAERTILAEGGDPDYPLLLDALYYIEEYGDAVHHVREDAIYILVRERYPHAGLDAENLLGEHTALARLTGEVQSLLLSAYNDVVVDRATVQARLGDYIERQRAHMDREETRMFPLLEATLGEADWREIDAQAGGADDPLFGEALQNRYRALFRRIVSA